MAEAQRPAGRSADTLVLLPATTYSAGLLRALPFIRYYGERSLPDLAALREPSTRAVLVVAEPIDGWIVDRALRELEDDEQRRRDMRRRLTCVVASIGGHESLADAVLADARVLAALKDALRGRSGLLVNFAASPSTDALAQRLGIPVEEGGAQLAARWGTKSGAKSIFLEAGVACPRGEPRVARGVAALTRAALRLAHDDPPPARVIVKLDVASWGNALGNAVVDCDALRRSGDLERSLQALAQPWSDYRREVAAGGAIVEEFVENATSSPSAQAVLDGAGGFELLATHEQLLDAGEYRGVRFPAPVAAQPEIGEAMRRVGLALARRGVRGSFGVDFVLADDRLLATEINLRKVGPTHIVKAVRARLAGDPGGSIVGLPATYVHRRHYEPDLFTRLDARRAHAAFERAGLDYDPHTRTGVLLSLVGALRPTGFVETTALAPSAERADELDGRARAVLVEAAGAAAATAPATA